MTLNKFLRKYSRTLILVFMSLLLIAFLVPQSIQNMGGGGQGASIKIGEAFGKSVTTNDIRRAQSDLNLLTRAGLIGRLPDNAVLDYYLLMEEADRMGVRVGEKEVKAGLVEAGVTDQDLIRIQKSTHRSYNEIYRVIGRWMAVRRLQGFQATGIAPSIPRAELRYRNNNQKAQTKMSVVSDEAFMHLVPEPTEEDLQAFFEESKDRFEEHTETELVFGYRLPDRVKIEWLTVDPESMKSRIKIRGVNVRRYFEENAGKYTKPAEGPTAPGEDAQQTAQVPMTYEEAEEQVRADFREQKAIEEAQRLVNEMYNEAHRAWAMAPRGDDGFPDLPADQVRTLADVRDEFADRVDIRYEQTELLGPEELRQIPGLGRAQLSMGRQGMVQFPQLALRVEGILEEDPADGRPAVALGEPAPPIFESRFDPATRQRIPRQAYLFRVIEVAPSAPPESLDVVREQVVEDWKKMKAREIAREQIDQVVDKAKEVGLAQAIEQATELRDILATAETAATQPAEGLPATVKPNYLRDLEPFSPPTMTRQASFVRRVGRVSTLPEAVFSLANEPGDHRVTSVPIASQFKWVIVELEEIEPIYREPFEDQLAQATQSAQTQELRRFFFEWLSPTNVQERTGFEYAPGREPTPAASR